MSENKKVLPLRTDSIPYRVSKLEVGNYLYIEMKERKQINNMRRYINRLQERPDEKDKVFEIRECIVVSVGDLDHSPNQRVIQIYRWR